MPAYTQEPKLLDKLIAKHPQPLASGRPSLTRLPRELWVWITEFVHAMSPLSIANLALVNSLFYCLAEASRYQHLSFDLTTKEDADITFMCKQIEFSGLISAIRKVTIKPRPLNSRQRHQPMDQTSKHVVKLTSLLPLMTGLRRVSYQGPCLENEVFQTLKMMPHVKLETLIQVHVESNSSLETQNNNLTRLHGSLNLFRLDVTITYFEAEKCVEAMRSLKTTLQSCLNLRHLSLQVAQPSDGAMSIPSEQYCGLGFEKGEKISPLEHLSLLAYPFGHKPLIDGRAFDISSKGYPLEGNEIDFWADTFDWSCLRHLQTPDGNFALAIMPHLKVLKEFEHTGSHPWGNIARFVLNIPSTLTSISVRTLESTTLDGILRHSSSLQKLRVHEPEGHGRDWNNNAIDLAFLTRMQRSCHHVVDLSLDIARSGAWPYDTLDILSSFTNLKRLELWFELGRNDMKNPVQPYLTFTAAEHLFSYLRSHPSSNRSPLERLVLRSGEWHGPGAGLHTPQTFWPSYNKTSFVCELSERDDRAANGVFTIDCPEVSAQMARIRASGISHWQTPVRKSSESKRAGIALQNQAQLRNGRARPRMRNGIQNFAILDGSSEAALVARDGPFPIERWIAHY